MKRVILALSAMALLGGCGLLGGKDKPKTPTIGNRVSVLSGEAAIEVDPALAGVAVSVSGPTANPDWPQAGGNAAKSVGHVALGNALGHVWAASIGEGSNAKVRLASGPVVGGGRIYAVDTRATLSALDAATGRVIWRRPVGKGGDNSRALFGGGVVYDNDRLYATNGLGAVEAFNATSGDLLWTAQPGGPLRGAPTVANDNLYVVSQDNQLFALNPADGKLRWQRESSLEQAGVLGVASPASAQGTVVAGFSSGELDAYRYENGRPLWQDVLTRTTISTAVATLSDIDANPVIDNGRVFAIGQGGRMVAMELNTGQRIWEINIAGISTPWVAGEWIFVVTDQAQLLAIARSTGRIRWISQLPRFRDEEDKEGPIFWRGPLLAGDRLVLASSNGMLVNVGYRNGAIISTVKTGERISLTPIVAGNTLYVLSDEGRLSAWR
jgi:outer membrane protein assembly factor BamB